MTDTPTVPAGWYPDPNAPGGQRWWDGSQWTEHVGQQAQPYQAFAPLTAPEGTKTNTVWIWILAALPLVGLINLFIIDWRAVAEASIPSSLGQATNPYGSLSLYSSPGYLIGTLIGWVLYGVQVVLAALDRRELVKRGVPQPFHWAFAFLTSIVYMIGRSVVVKRRTGGGLAPLWVYITTSVIVMIGYIIVMVLLFSYLAQSINTLTPIS